MKYLSVLLVVIILSCSKENDSSTKCYTCTFRGYGTVIVKDTCTDDVTSIRYYDINGAAFSSTCEPK
jgi:hypothetical protein